jgi:hypothetical protein
MHPHVVFDNIDSSFVEKCFLQAHQGFKDLHANKIILSRKPLGKTNMQAQPVRNLHFWSKKKRAYRITMSNHIKFEQYFKPEELSEEVLVGWFAHELGHVMDYLDRSGWDLIKFAMGYLFLKTIASVPNAGRMSSLLMRDSPIIWWLPNNLFWNMLTFRASISNGSKNIICR